MKKILLLVILLAFTTSFSVTTSSQANVMEEENELSRKEFVDPREIKDALNQINDVKKQTQRILKKAQKSANFTNEINELNNVISEASRLYNLISTASEGSDQRDALQEFYDMHLWDSVETIRIKIEFPNELKMVERELKMLEKLISSKRFSIEKIDMNVVNSHVQEIKSAIAEARNSFNAGDFEEAREAMQVVYEGSHPGEIMGVLHQLREMNSRLKSMKSEIKEVFHDALSPVYEAINSGDFREANMLLSDIRNELWRLLDKIKDKRSGMSDELRSKLRALEDRLINKQDEIERQQDQNSAVPAPQSYKPYKLYRASVFDSIADWMKSLFSF